MDVAARTRVGSSAAPLPPALSEQRRIRTAYARRAQGDARYSCFHPAHLLAVQERERLVLAMLERHGYADLAARRIIEIGCGSGFWLREFIKWGAKPENLTGLDLIPQRVLEAKRLTPTGVKLACGDAAAFNLPSERFDLVVQATVFTSILDDRVRQRIAAEMQRILKPDGMILWYDFRVDNPWNPDVRGVRASEIKRLFPDCAIELRRMTLAPPLLRRIAPYSWLACHLLAQVPWLCTHLLGAIQKR